MDPSKESKIVLPVRIGKKEINQLLKNHVPIIEAPGNIQIEEIQVLNLDQQLVLLLVLKGRISGKLKADLNVSFENKKKYIKIQLDRLEFLEKGFLNTGINWAIDSLFKDRIEKRIEEIANSNLKKYLQSYLNQSLKFSLPEDFAIKMLVDDFEVKELKIKNDILDFKINIEGSMELFSNSILSRT